MFCDLEKWRFSRAFQIENAVKMGQLEDFRESLKRKDSAVNSEGEIPVKSIAKAKQEKMKRRTLGLAVGNSSVQ